MRPIQPLSFPNLAPADLSGQQMGILDWVPTATLVSNDVYQRNVDRPRIRRMVESWANEHCAPLIVALLPDGTLEILDGQHRAIAAITHGGIERLPCLIIDRTALPDRARLSVAHAKDRKGHTPGQLWKARVVAGDPEAVVIKQVCERAGVRLLPFAPPNGYYASGESVALASIKALIARRGDRAAREVLSALARAELAPITGEMVKAAEALMCEDDYRSEFDEERLVASIKALGSRALVEAKELAAAKSLPMWRALVATIYKHRKGRAPAVPSEGLPSPKPAPVPAAARRPLPRLAVRPPEPAAYSPGDPLPGRSALDQRSDRA